MNKYIEERTKTAREIDLKDLDACVKLWEPIGFLFGIDDEDTKKKVAQELTRMAKYLLYTDGAYMNSIWVCAFPTVRKIFTSKKEVNKDYSPKEVCEQLQLVLKEFANILIIEEHKIDFEAEACSVVSDLFTQTDEI